MQPPHPRVLSTSLTDDMVIVTVDMGLFIVLTVCQPREICQPRGSGEVLFSGLGVTGCHC